MFKIRRNIRSLAGDIMADRNTLLPNFSGESVHRLCTTYKKLQALIVFTGSFIPGLPEPGKEIRDFYRALGELRNIQLMAVRIQNEYLPEKPETLKLLAKMESRTKKYISAVAFTKIIRKWINKNTNSFPKTIPEIDIRLYFNECVAKIEAIAFQQFVENDDLHVVRKLLKNVYYLLVMAGFWEKDIPDHWAELMNNLGAFYNNFLQRELINKLMPDIDDKNERAYLQRMSDMYEQQGEQMRKSLITEIIAKFGQKSSNHLSPLRQLSEQFGSDCVKISLQA